jgi:tetrahydromethanopterin S-methyltransferase subunit A
LDKRFIGFSEDPAGFFYIYLDEATRNIIVEHYQNVIKEVEGNRRTVSGKVNKVFRGNNAETLYRTILGNNLVSLMDHAAYLGYELGKAETALKNGVKYEQDKPLRV